MKTWSKFAQMGLENGKGNKLGMEQNNESFQYRMTEKLIKHFEAGGFWKKERCFADYLERNSEKFPDKEAIVDRRHRITFSEFDRIVDNLASNLLEMGIHKNDVVGVQPANWAEYFFMRNALAKIGAIIINIGIGLRRRELKYILEVTRAKGIVAPSFFHHFNYLEMIEELMKSIGSLEFAFIIEHEGKAMPGRVNSFDEMIADRQIADEIRGGNFRNLTKGPNEIDMLSLTSGTTGVPKICQFTPNSRMLFGKQIVERCGITSDDSMLVICPITTGLGNSCSSLAAGHAGAKLVLQERFEPEEALQLIEKENITILVGVTAQIIKILAVGGFSKYNFDSLRMVINAGSYLPRETAKDIIEKMGVSLVSIFGSHDGGTITVGTPDLDLETVMSTVGRPLPDAEIKIMDFEGREVSEGEVGEAVYRSGNGCSGYFGDLESTRASFSADGFFHSGDLVRLTGEGFIEVKGRIKDIIIRGGQNINPEEIEDMLIDHPDVENVAIVGMPDPVLGERSCAFVVQHKDANFTFNDMILYLKNKEIATFKLPEKLELIQEMPLSEGGKPAKNILRKQYFGN